MRVLAEDLSRLEKWAIRIRMKFSKGKYLAQSNSARRYRLTEETAERDLEVVVISCST